MSLIVVALILASVASVFAAASGMPAVAATETGSETTLSDDITDTENLLGSDFSTVSDAIARTKRTTGVSVRLLYVSSFGTETSPSAWAADLLESLEPPANTVLLAVASSDGNLVVAVSSNSDSWLRSQATVDDLSAAALKPLVKGDDPDWSGSALAMMSEISTRKATATSSRTRVIGSVAMGVVLVVLVVLGVVLTLRRRRSSHHSRGGRRHGRKTRKDAGSFMKQMAGLLPGRGRNGRRSSPSHRHRRKGRRGASRASGDGDRKDSVGQDSDGVQGTSRDPGQSGRHEQSD